MHEFDTRLVDMEDYIRSIGDMDDFVVGLLMVSVGRVLLKSGVTPRHVGAYDERARKAEIGHVRDWLEVAVSDGASWLSNLDDQGRPKKLMKFATLDAIGREADRQMARKQARLGKSSLLVEGEEEVVYDAGEGWSVVRLMAPAALDRESEAMQHCIGHGSYDEDLSEEGVFLLSLRDPRGKPHATIEIRGGELVQFQGKQNSPPVERYVTRCLPYFVETGVKCQTESLVTDVEGVVHSVYDLPDVLTVEGSASLVNSTGRRLRLPRQLVVSGDLAIKGDAFANTPDIVEVGGSLYVRGEALAALPPALSVGQSLSLIETCDMALPHGLRVNGDLVLLRSGIKSLPSGLDVRGGLNLEDTKVSELPVDLKCANLNVSGTCIKRFDTGVFRSASIAPVGTLTARNCALEEIAGTPDFQSLDLTGSQVKALPAGLVVGLELNISSTGITRITEDMRVRGRLVADNCEIDIAISHVGDSVSFRKSKIGLPQVFRCESLMRINDCEFVVMPRRLECGSLLLDNVVNRELPAEIVAKTDVDLSRSGVHRLEGVVVAERVVVGPEMSFVGDGVRVEKLLVSKDRFIRWGMSLDGIRKHLAKGGDLSSPPEGADVSMPLSMVAGRTGSGKSWFMSKLLHDGMQHRGPVTISFEAPIEFPELSNGFAGGVYPTPPEAM